MAEGPFLPYGRQLIEDDDIAAVTAALRSDMLTTGPRVEAFEEAFAKTVGARFAVACSSGTAALHLSMLALDLRPGDVAIAPAITFAATANCVRYQRGEVVFADVDPDSGLMTAQTLASAMDRLDGRRLAAVLPVHLAGHVVDLPGVRRLAREHGAKVVEDACHALGTTMTFDGRPERVGDARHSAMACFSFHPVKTIATGEGGMVTTNDPVLAQRLRLFRTHGVTRDPALFQHRAFDQDGESIRGPMRCRLLATTTACPTSLCALGISQLGQAGPVHRAATGAGGPLSGSARPLSPTAAVRRRPGCDPALHLFVALIDFAAAAFRAESSCRRCRRAGSAARCTISRCTASLTTSAAMGRSICRARTPTTRAASACRCSRA